MVRPSELEKLFFFDFLPPRATRTSRSPPILSRKFPFRCFLLIKLLKALLLLVNELGNRCNALKIIFFVSFREILFSDRVYLLVPFGNKARPEKEFREE